jgi:hypothetical protein
MKKILKAVVPPTKNAGSCKIIGICSFYETTKQNILWTYNQMLKRDGFQAVKKMPSGTKYQFTTGIGIL